MGAPAETQDSSQIFPVSLKACCFAAKKLTFGTVEHPEGISVMMTKKLSHYDRMMLFNQLQVKRIEFLRKPWLVSLLLKEPRRNMANDEHLVEGEETATNY